MTLLASWCALRFGELTELRRKDIIISSHPQVLQLQTRRRRSGGLWHRPHRARSCPRRGRLLGDDTKVGRRPPRRRNSAHICCQRSSVTSRPTLNPNRDALLFPAVNGGHMAPAMLYRHFYRARSAANRDDLRWHDLRHSGAVLAAATGATLAELMARLGHSTPRRRCATNTPHRAATAR